MEVNLPEIVAEVTAEFERYETAFVTNDVEVLDELFWDDPLVVRYGAGENLYSHAAIARFREQRPTGDLEREIVHAVVTTFGRDLAVTSAEFRRTRSGRVGRQSQTWVRTQDGWRIVTAHVSQLDLLQPASR
ncbi:MAG TPA: oxalurate catabolism protein HpxZ [Solirubrobacteraceae bacterium]|nr:oxalurate catabolism protein HpxZ [Solirubrobacteraceae bacterium]